VLLIAWFFSATGREGIILFMLILTIIWARQRKWREVAMILLGVGGGEALFQILGGMIGRHRPVFPDPLEVLPGPGFPSGHTTTSILLFGLFLYLLWRRLPSNTWRAVGVFLVIFMVSAIGAARMYIGDHYLTDIVSGAALGTAWAGLIYTTIEMVSWRRAHPDEQPG
jgi:undecaprenyl-diphosphatase